MKKIFLSAAAALLVSNSFAFVAEPTVKGSAMGGAYTTGAGDDIFAASFNPASSIDGLGQLGAAWHKRESAENIFSLGYGQNLPAGFQLQAFGNYLYDQNDTNTMQMWEARAGLGFDLRKLYEKLPLSVGLNAKYGTVTSRGNSKADSAITADLGVIANLNPFKIGFVYNNIAGALKDIYTHNTWAIGGSYMWVINDSNSLDLRVDFGKENLNGRSSFGAEYRFWILALRGGYIKITDLTQNFTWGVGVSLGEYGRIDAAYLPYDYNKTYKLSYVIPFGFKGGDSIIGPAAAVNPYYDGAGSTYGDSSNLNAVSQSAGNITPQNQVHNVYAGAGLPDYVEPAASGAREVTPSTAATTAAAAGAPAQSAPRDVYIYPGMQYDDGSVAALKAINAKKAAQSATTTKKPQRTMQ
ncbi:MAG: hypothetical protein FWF35_05740 [Elusimicrobia bacterium]|nr:hypothetical protein [Elusimicrobiota bacterium]